jgi:hypothetical protein
MWDLDLTKRRRRAPPHPIEELVPSILEEIRSSSCPRQHPFFPLYDEASKIVPHGDLG